MKTLLKGSLPLQSLDSWPWKSMNLVPTQPEAGGSIELRANLSSERNSCQEMVAHIFLEAAPAKPGQHKCHDLRNHSR